MNFKYIIFSMAPLTLIFSKLVTLFGTFSACNLHFGTYTTCDFVWYNLHNSSVNFLNLLEIKHWLHKFKWNKGKEMEVYIKRNS